PGRGGPRPGVARRWRRWSPAAAGRRPGLASAGWSYRPPSTSTPPPTDGWCCGGGRTGYSPTTTSSGRKGGAFRAPPGGGAGGAVRSPAEGEALLELDWIGIDATVRTWLSKAEGYLPAVEIGETV